MRRIFLGLVVAAGLAAMLHPVLFGRGFGGVRVGGFSGFHASRSFTPSFSHYSGGYYRAGRVNVGQVPRYSGTQFNRVNVNRSNFNTLQFGNRSINTAYVGNRTVNVNRYTNISGRQYNIGAWNGAWRNGYYRSYRGGWYDGWHGWVNGRWNWPGRYYPYGWGWGPSYGWNWAYTGAAAALGGYYGSYIPLAYSNPYYVVPVQPVAVYLNYSQPLQSPPIDVQAQQPAVNPYGVNAPVPATDVTPAQEDTSPPPPTMPKEAMADFDSARDAFKSGDYNRALDLVTKAIAQVPGDAALHEFRALVLFAQKKYREEAATLYAVLSSGPGWNWATVASLYADTQTYTGQLRALEAYVRANPDDAAGHFDLAYQYLVIGYPDAAIKQLEQVVKLNPKDQLSAGILKALQGPVTVEQPMPTPGM
jgi:hypothetical protein